MAATGRMRNAAGSWSPARRRRPTRTAPRHCGRSSTGRRSRGLSRRDKSHADFNVANLFLVGGLTEAMKVAVTGVTVFPGWESLEGHGRLRTSKAAEQTAIVIERH